MRKAPSTRWDSRLWLLSTGLTIALTGITSGVWAHLARDRTDFSALPNPLIVCVISTTVLGVALLAIRRRGITPTLAVVHAIAVVGILLSIIPTFDILFWTP